MVAKFGKCALTLHSETTKSTIRARPHSWRESDFAHMGNNSKMPLNKWLPLIGLTCSAFVFNTSEFIPIGLLTDIATDFGLTEAKAEMLISVYA